MKIQSLAVVFAIIILPIVIILSYYIHAEVDTIAIQTSYDTKLIDSTHDAMVAFEINTANEDLSTVADSLRSIIEASTNVFFNTLATNLGISNAGNSAVDSYVPALLYTLYDGYYIYSPTRNPKVLTYPPENGDDIIYVGDRGVRYLRTSTYRNSNNELVEFGVYEFDAAEYALEKDDDPSNNEPETAKMDRYNALPGTIKYEFGQMLYLNEDGTYSAQVHTNKQNPGDPDPTTGNTKYNQEHVLKSYMPYSARYKRDNAFDITINYTLDNYLTIAGTIGSNTNKAYYSKTGYLISKDTVTSVDVGGITDILDYNEITAEEMILSGQNDITLKIDPIMENGKRTTDDGGSEIEIKYNRIDNGEGGYLSYVQIREKLTKLYETQDANITEIQNLEYAAANLSAISYYVKAQIFSNWVYENLGGTQAAPGNAIKASDVVEDVIIENENNKNYTTDSEFDVYHKFKEYDDAGNIIDQDNTVIFNTEKNPELEDSPFASHRFNVIRNNIQYNLNLAISSYNQMLQARNVQMPVIKEDEWNQILTRISVVSFLQGLKCGMKDYNNYAIASSTNNELTVIPSEIFYTYKENYNTAGVSLEDEYHKIDCDKLLGDDANPKEYISFKSKEVKYDKLYNKTTKLYSYDHRNLACYRCSIASNYEKDLSSDAAGNVTRGYSDDIKISMLSPIKRKAYYTAVGKERQNLYKTNAITDSNGFEIYYNNPVNTFANVDPDPTLKTFSGDNYILIGSGTSTRDISEIREIEITLRDLKCDNANEATVNFRLRLNGSQEIDYNVVLNLAQKTPQTMVIPIHIPESHSLANQKLNKVELKKVDLADNVYCHDLNVKIVYE
ncbi:MAG: hypothetical protein J6A36_00440 [Clostridia bacterium]|nr:hypothetical protein [Clostridia bacterium]